MTSSRYAWSYVDLQYHLSVYFIRKEFNSCTTLSQLWPRIITKLPHDSIVLSATFLIWYFNATRYDLCHHKVSMFGSFWKRISLSSLIIWKHWNINGKHCKCLPTSKGPTHFVTTDLHVVVIVTPRNAIRPPTYKIQSWRAKATMT